MSSIFDIHLDSQSQQLIRTATSFSPELGKTLATIGKNAVNGVGELALKALKSKVPIDTLELRGHNLDDGQIRQTKATFSNSISSVFVSNAIHYGRSRNPIPADKLAEILNIGTDKGKTLHRTQTSAAIAPYTAEPGARTLRGNRTRGTGRTTAGWIDKATIEFLSALPLYVKRTNFL